MNRCLLVLIGTLFLVCNLTAVSFVQEVERNNGDVSVVLKDQHGLRVQRFAKTVKVGDRCIVTQVEVLSGEDSRF